MRFKRRSRLCAIPTSPCWRWVASDAASCFPFSDVDVLILIERESQAARHQECALRICPPAVGRGSAPEPFGAHRLPNAPKSTRATSSSASACSTAGCSLGSPDLYAKLENKLPAFFERQAHALTRHLCQLARERHEKFQGTFYHLEPNVKETPGGLRDLHLIDWLGKLRKRRMRKWPLAWWRPPGSFTRCAAFSITRRGAIRTC